MSAKRIQRKGAKPQRRKEQPNDDLEFRRGYYHATANIIRTHDEPVVAEDVLRNYGAVDFFGIDSFDLKVLRPIAKEIERKKNL